MSYQDNVSKRLDLLERSLALMSRFLYVASQDGSVERIPPIRSFFSRFVQLVSDHTLFSPACCCNGILFGEVTIEGVRVQRYCYSFMCTAFDLSWVPLLIEARGIRFPVH